MEISLHGPPKMGYYRIIGSRYGEKKNPNNRKNWGSLPINKNYLRWVDRGLKPVKMKGLSQFSSGIPYSFYISFQA